jgi:hypothetical protein
MRKFLIVMFTFAVALALAMPVSAKTHKKKETAKTAETGSAHMKHSKKKGTMKGKKKGQEGGSSKKS